MKTFRLLFLTAISLQMIATIACSGGGSSSGSTTYDGTVSSTTVTNDSGGSTDGSGVSSNSSISVVNGNISISTNDGNITINGSELNLTTQNEEGTWSLANNVEITLTDNSGNEISGTIVVNSSTGVITFIPDTSLDVNETYTISIEVDGTQYEATVIVAVDDTNTEESLFAGVDYLSAGTYSIQDLIVDGRAIFGWEFGENPTSFTISLKNIDAGATVYLTAYGTYNIDGHETETYYQKWESTGEPVKDYVWNGSTISINEEDSSLDGETDYSFWSTYIELKVISSEGVDITADSQVQLVVKTN